MDTLEFLRHHFADLRDDEVLELRFVYEPKGTKPVVQRYYGNDKLERAALSAAEGNAEGFHVYYGVLPRSKQALREGKRGRDAVSRVTHIWIDLDDIDETGTSPTFRRFFADLPPRAVVATGGGLQYIWAVTDEGSKLLPPTPEAAETLLRHLAVNAGGDTHATDLARVLRLPGTVNHKPKYPTGTTASVVHSTDSVHPFSATYFEAVGIWDLPATGSPSTPPEQACDPADIDAAEFLAALDAIDPMDLTYDEWVRCLMAIHAWGDGPEGLALAERWGQGKPGEIATKWRSFRRNGTNPSTIFYFARAAGWRPDRTPESGPGLIDDIPALERRKRPGPAITLTSLKDFFAEQDDGVQWLVDGLLNAGGTSLLVAKPKVGKSTWAANLAVAVAAGLPFMGHKVRQGAVHVYSLEVHRTFVRDQYATLVGAHGLKEAPDIRIHAATGVVQAPFDQIARLVLAERPALVIIDTLAKAVDTLKDGNDYMEVYRALQPIAALAEESGAHIVCIHHANKGLAEGADAVMGSAAFAASVDLTIVLKRDREADLRTMEFEARFLPESDPVAFDYDEARKLVLLGDRDRVLREGAEGRILAALATTPGLTATEIRQYTGLPEGIAGPALHQLARTMRVEAEGSPKRYTAVTYVAGAQAPAVTQKELPR